MRAKRLRRAAAPAAQNFGDTLDTLVPLTARHWYLILKVRTIFATQCPFTLLKSKCLLFYTKVIKFLIKKMFKIINRYN